MNKIVLFIAVCFLCISTFYFDPVSNAYAVSDNRHPVNIYSQYLPIDTIQERKPNGEENDLLMVSEKNGDTVTCYFQNDKENNFNCKQYNKNDYPELYTGFIKNYLGSNKKAKQYAYFINSSGLLLTECELSIQQINDNPYIKNCQIRRDIKLPVRIISGKVLSSVNKLLLIGENSEVYRCSYNSENKISGCYLAGIKNISATDAEFNPVYNKVYLYSANTGKVYACDAINGDNSIKNCLPVDLNTDFPDANIRKVISVPDGKHVLLAEKSTLHYCNINNQTMKLDNCVTVYDKFYNIVSLTYSKNNDTLLYVLDNNAVKACYFDDVEVHCHEIKLNNNSKLISANKLSSATAFTFVSLKIKNKGGYKLKASYTTKIDADIGVNIRDEKGMFFNSGKKLLIKRGSGIELHAVGGNTKCFIANEPGEIHCSRGALNMACYYNNSSKYIINGSCSFNSYKSLCSANLLTYLQLSGNAIKSCGYWKINYKKNNITAACNYYDDLTRDNTISCLSVWKAMKSNNIFTTDLNGRLCIGCGLKS